jgi:hypothetical protein
MAVRSAYLAKKGDKPAKSKSDLKNSGLTAEEERQAYYDRRVLPFVHWARGCCGWHGNGGH